MSKNELATLGTKEITNNVNDFVEVKDVTVFNDEGSNYIVELTNTNRTYCSIIGDDKETKARIFNIAANPDKRLADCIGETLNITDLFVEIVSCTNEETGEITKCPRIIAVDNKGVSYQCVSLGIFSAFKRLMSLYGEPTWTPFIPLTIQQINKGQKRLLTLKVATK